jgi:hypothetical protein
MFNCTKIHHIGLATRDMDGTVKKSAAASRCRGFC